MATQCAPRPKSLPEERPCEALGLVSSTQSLEQTYDPASGVLRGEIISHECVTLPGVDPTKVPVTTEEIGAALGIRRRNS
jgi:hypothetical protein